MTTPRDLQIVAMIVAAGGESPRPVDAGDLSLALAGAELIDLLHAEAVTLDGDRIVPGERGRERGQGQDPSQGQDRTTPADRLLDAAAASLVRQAPYESVEDWLWRRGRGLSAVYRAALKEEGLSLRKRRLRLRLRAGRTAPAGSSAARGHAAGRWASGEPVLAALAAAAGIRDAPADDALSGTDDAVMTVLAAVNEAVVELEAVRQRRTVEQAAFDNIWRGA
ncbi:GPP34 family phosphoprotein [Streptomyces sp. NPDC052496]|uniref:GPP34 family phosphoprotein n=1 Tax=Streptomyces sp. NPDC052496 TaxID=3154951 RepID=UPI00343FE82D